MLENRLTPVPADTGAGTIADQQRLDEVARQPTYAYRHLVAHRQ